MNNTPRALNRVLIGILGILLLAIGVLLILLASVPAVGVWWHEWAGGVLSFWLDLFERTQFPRRQLPISPPAARGSSCHLRPPGRPAWGTACRYK